MNFSPRRLDSLANSITVATYDVLAQGLVKTSDLGGTFLLSPIYEILRLCDSQGVLALVISLQPSLEISTRLTALLYLLLGFTKTAMLHDEDTVMM